MQVGFHVFIFTQVAVGVPQEWNLFMILAGVYLFGMRGGVSLAEMQAMPLGLKALLLAVEVCVPLLGSFAPKYVPFLPCMRYYAGNWPISIWLVKRSACHKLHALRSPVGEMHDQVWCLYGPDGVTQMCENTAFYAMHLHGRLLPKLIPMALPGGDARRYGEYQYHIGELVAGLALGYNFGDGYLHGPFFLN